MNYIRWSRQAGLFLVLFGSGVCASAADVAIDCGRKNIEREIGKLDMSQANTVTLTGSCAGNLSFPEGSQITLVGSPGASIDALVTDTPAIQVREGRLALRGLTVRGGSVLCNQRSVCLLDTVVVQEVPNDCVMTQDNSALDVTGNSVISGCGESGIGVYGGSTVNVRPGAAWNVTPDAPAHSRIMQASFAGILVMDGSFLRVDGAEISNNSVGVYVQRNATAKLYVSEFDGVAVGGISGNSSAGIQVTFGSVADVGLPVHDNVGTGLVVGPLSMVQMRSEASGNGTDFVCTHATAFVRGTLSCP